MDRVVAVDWETYYGDDLSVKKQGNVVYASLTDIFMVGVYGDGVQYVGSPREAPWEKIAGAHWVSHNAGFDQAVWRAAVARGLIPEFPPARWDCTADLSSFMGLGRKLEDAVKNAFGVEIPKTIRTRAGNRHWPEDFNEKMKAAFLEYCLADARWCYELWMKYFDQWPSEEREFADIVRLRSALGIYIDRNKLESSKSILKLRVREAREQIPWDDPPLSRARLVAWCNEMGVEPPKSTAQKNDDCEKWIEEHGADYPVIFWLRQFRKSVKRLALCEAAERRIMADGRMNFSLKYHGAGNTGRLSGSDGLNMQNLNRDEDGGVDLRSIFIAAPGTQFVICDYAQIEPRVTAWICQDQKLLNLLRQGMNFYEVDARMAGVWAGEPGTLKSSNKALYQTQKAATLGLAYGMGVPRFIEAARSQLGLEFDYEQATKIKDNWHARYPKVRKIWNKLELGLRQSLAKKSPLTLRLPSGRVLTYYDLRWEKGGITGSTSLPVKGTKRMRYWGGVLFENIVQATARDVLRDAIIRLERAGLPVVFSSHDEVIVECNPGFPRREIERIMTIPPDWAPDLPLGAEAVTSARYLKP